MVVHGPFQPNSSSKDKMKALSKIDKRNNVEDRLNSQAYNLTEEQIKQVNRGGFEKENEILDTKVKRRPSGFWKYINGCFGGNTSKRRPMKPRAPEKFSSNAV